MTRKPSATTPTAEDISRHEEAVAAYLSRTTSEEERTRMAGLRPSEKLAMLLGLLIIALRPRKPGEVEHVNGLLLTQLRIEALADDTSAS